MYENYTRQSLASKEYRELLGTAIYVFNANNAFIIENILRNDESKKYTWHSLMDLTSGKLIKKAKQTILNEAQNQNNEELGNEIIDLFQKLIEMRNRIIHSFAITDTSNKQILSTKDKNNRQFIISIEILMKFIKDNEKLALLLHDFRGY